MALALIAAALCVPHLAVASGPTTAALQAPMQTDARATVRLIRSTAGTKGRVVGSRYAIDDPRTAFGPEDPQIVVYFEWEGTTGTHQCQATWKNPSGKVVFVSPLEVRTQGRRFGAYWTLTLPETPALGLWAVVADVDGQGAGTHVFQIQSTAAPAGVQGASRRLLDSAEIYKRASAATAVVESILPGGEVLRRGSGFFLDERLLVTAFQVIDGASAARITLADGRTLTTDAAAARDRRQDWIVLQTPSIDAPRLPVEQPQRWEVGDHASYVETHGDGSRILAEAIIVGVNVYGRAGRRINLRGLPRLSAAGAPLVSDYGEIIGVLGGTLSRGAGPTEGLAFAARQRLDDLTLPDALAVPIALIPSQARLETPVLFADLDAQGEFVPVFRRSPSLVSATLARGIEKKSGVPLAVDQTAVFGRQDPHIVVFTTWQPKVDIAGKSTLRLYDEDNRLVFAKQPSEFKLKRGVYAVGTWSVPLAPTLEAGNYRVDLQVNGEVVARLFFRFSE
jgi:S1-C subfamily serine protease